MTTLHIAWLAGLLEGEASFMRRNGSPSIKIQLTDRDVLDRAASILGGTVGRNSYQPKGKATYKPVYHLSIHGMRAIAWMMTLYPMLGVRRRKKVREILEAWKSSRSQLHASRGTRTMAICHRDKPVVARGLCQKCYMREWRKNGRNGTYYRNRAKVA